MSQDNHCMGHNKELDIWRVYDQLQARTLLIFTTHSVNKTTLSIFKPEFNGVFVKLGLGQLHRIMT